MKLLNSGFDRLLTSAPKKRQSNRTKVATELVVTHSSGKLKSDGRTWRQIIDFQLREWDRHPDRFEDTGVEPPDSAAVGRAIAAAKLLCDSDVPAPHSVILDPNGGIVFEWRDSFGVEVMHFWSDGTDDAQIFHGTRLVERSSL